MRQRLKKCIKKLKIINQITNLIHGNHPMSVESVETVFVVIEFKPFASKNKMKIHV